MTSQGDRARLRNGGRLVAVSLAALISVAACGGGSSGGSSPSSSGTSGGGNAPGLAEAQKVVDQFKVRPTSTNSDSSLITNNTPVGKTIPSGKTVDFVSCGAPSCDALGEVVVEAAKSIGWTGTLLHTDGSPQQIQNAWQQIVRTKPAGAIIAGTAVSEAQPYVKQAAANGTAVATYAVTDALGSKSAAGVIWATSTAEQFGIFGKIIAAQILTDASSAGDTSPSVLFLNIPDISINDQATAQFKSSMTEWCPACSVSNLNLGLATIQNAPNQIISFLRSHPDVKYIASTNDGSFVGITNSLKSAGLSEISYYGAAPVTANLQQIQSGQQAATVALGQWEGMYGALDAIIRHTVGVPLVPGNQGAVPAWILDKSDLATTGFGTSTFPKSGLVPLDADIASHYLSLWGKG